MATTATPPDAAWPDAAHDTVGSLLAAIATSLQDTLRLLMFADKRGWGPDEFEQVRAVEEALDEAKRDFQTMAPLVNGQFYYEGDRRVASLNELRALRVDFFAHAQVFRDWIRTGGPIHALWVRDTVALRRRLHRAQCRAARRIFNAEHQDADGSGSGARCLGAFLLYRRLRENADARRAYAEAVAAAAARKTAADTSAGRESHASSETPPWKQQQPRLHAQEKRQSVGREPLSSSRANAPVSRWRAVGVADESVDGSTDGSVDGFVVLEMTPQAPAQVPSPSTTQGSQQPELRSPQQDTPLAPRQQRRQPPEATLRPPLPPPPLTLEDLVADCQAVGSFERFGDHDIAFICNFCDGHIVWEDVQRLPTARVPPPAVSSNDAAAAAAAAARRASPLSSRPPPSTSPLPLALKLQPLRQPPQPASSSFTSSSSSPSPPPSNTPLPDDTNEDAYPRWQATAVAASSPDKPPRTIVFAPLAVANHLPPAAGGWEARLWCPYCDTYLYYDSAAGDHTRYAQDEDGFNGLADFQAHLEWHHTALPLPALPSVLPALSALSSTAKESCAVM